MKKHVQNILILSLFSFGIFSCDEGFRNSEEADEAPVESVENISEISSEAELDYETDPQIIESQLQEISPDLSAETETFYKNRDFKTAWQKEGNRKTFLELLEKVEEEGLTPGDYQEDKLLEILSSTEAASEKIAQMDIYLTDAFFKYAHDLYFGKLEPRELYKNWGVSRKPIDLPGLLEKGLGNNDISATFNQLRPSHPIYSQLKSALEEYKLLKEKEQAFQKVEKGGFIKPGEKDSRVRSISKRLQELQLLPDSINVSDSIYSEALQESIKKFQKNKGLQVDGIIGNSTIAELNMTPTERYNQILANLERWRWYPRDLGEHYILINIPDFRLAVVKDGDTVRTHNVIAGSRARQTPVFTDTLEYIVINPQWNIPPTIKKEDVIPRAAKDPSYISSHNMKVIGRDGKTLDPATIDWSSSQVYSYNYVQRAGPSNPLGQVKIIYPNKYLIYLHDTPAQNLFSQNQRAESSGCVRVENAVDLSGYILNDQPDWQEEKIREAIASGVTKQVKINRPIQVHHFYWTAWRAGNKTVFTEDVYNLDKEIYSRLLQVN
ncbi:L,D-transpeptidase family protein [Salinimicrobium gaetbulicola]|uniref:Murein L,D-transpeptidase n=1 Tax=Salinimicrobium gaetbulicola TaxID=999702 RepID=A0ABW3IE60_9FLAO